MGACSSYEGSNRFILPQLFRKGVDAVWDTRSHINGSLMFFVKNFVLSFGKKGSIDLRQFHEHPLLKNLPKNFDHIDAVIDFNSHKNIYFLRGDELVELSRRGKSFKKVSKIRDHPVFARCEQAYSGVQAVFCSRAGRILLVFGQDKVASLVVEQQMCILESKDKDILNYLPSECRQEISAFCTTGCYLHLFSGDKVATKPIQKQVPWEVWPIAQHPIFGEEGHLRGFSSSGYV